MKRTSAHVRWMKIGGGSAFGTVQPTCTLRCLAFFHRTTVQPCMYTRRSRAMGGTSVASATRLRLSSGLYVASDAGDADG
eukprot:5309707-Prymnesium_polylepis.1